MVKNYSLGCNVIFVVVDRLTKHVSFIPITTGLDTEGFAQLFVKHIVCKFSLPESIITDRDLRWTTDFWLGIAKFLQTCMSLSSSHHPQHNGQTEVVNRLLTTMLRAFTSGKNSEWSTTRHGFTCWSLLTTVPCTHPRAQPPSISCWAFTPELLWTSPGPRGTTKSLVAH